MNGWLSPGQQLRPLSAPDPDTTTDQPASDEVAPQPDARGRQPVEQLRPATQPGESEDPAAATTESPAITVPDAPAGPDD